MSKHRREAPLSDEMDARHEEATPEHREPVVRELLGDDAPAEHNEPGNDEAPVEHNP